ncbi:hypothetical protein [Methylobacter sp.]|uniref:hypothetical protein n=1 Tax=Methylobacter sp. TaxID=2051955 RepID=UPI001225399D|nr:hypothetical protein [Methylobacter sp.]TAK59530.1 MAG: hypothetical protein EPO18_20425 [Methylobacter sp.]
MIESERKVSDIWWEGDDLHVVFADDGSEKIYKNAQVTKISDSLEGVKSEVVEYKHIGGT